MASKPGLFTEWPWKKLGNFKYFVLAPWVVHSAHKVMVEGVTKRDLMELAVVPILLMRLVHHLIWISLSRFQTAGGKHRIVSKSLEFEQVDRESNWDDQIILNGLFFYGFKMILSQNMLNMPLWNSHGAVIIALLHAGPVEFLYYWLHRALHHHYLYSRYHSHHHASIVTEPITAVIHPFAEEVSYFILFAIPILAAVFTMTASVLGLAGYLFYIDLMNNMGHCNFELVPKWLFDIFPPLKYLMYTPSFHSLHHTQFRTNYSLFMPIYDYLYCTVDKSTDSLYETTLRGEEEIPDVVHLTHPTTLQSIYHLRIGFASLASRPYSSRWYMWMMWPATIGSALLTWLYGNTFTVERNKLMKLKMQTWVIPRFSLQYVLSWEKEAINGLIEKAILDAEERGVKVISLGLLNQGEELNRNGGLYVMKHPKLRIKIVDGSDLAVAVVLHSIPKGTKQVLIRGKLTKSACAVAHALCQKGIQVVLINKDEYEQLKLRLPSDLGSLLVFNHTCKPQVWLVGDGLSEQEQKRAPKNTQFIPFSQLPPKIARNDCACYSTPAMMVPKILENMHSCENWLPRRVMSAWRIAGIIHGLEGWDSHECGESIMNVDKVWRAALRHGFTPLDQP
ncbi:Protein ECERIFERUM 1 [Acorus calamus]|uniref:aldehyde oxygenase (deformylating) n=1 Tax=Acorus calamus TaxID=4465 RepID=A0AAV9EAD3_ACOCL|nr:Protein ECERIFERUM 1 [Acorus calamus]